MLLMDGILYILNFGFASRRFIVEFRFFIIHPCKRWLG